MDKTSQDTPLGGFDSFEQKLGDELRGERATLGKSLLDVQRDLRIKAAYISAIENCDVSVFPNASFVAGYVRSYARYLALDPDATFARFCDEARFQSAGAELGIAKARKSEKAARDDDPATDPNGWVPRMPGFDTGGGARVGLSLAAAGPLLVLALVVGGIAYGAWFVLQDIQRVEFAPIEDTPMVAFEPGGLLASDAGNGGNLAAASVDIAADPSVLYTRRELDVPIVQPRDGPIFAIDPDTGRSDVSAPAATVVADVAPAGTPEPVAPTVSETIHVPAISLVAQQEAWVRVYQENGTIIFEKLLAAGEQYTLPRDAPVAYLRAGNATSLYLMVDDRAYGPVSTTKAVVRDIPLQPAKIESAMAEVKDPSVALQVAAEAWREMNTAQNTQ